jgi:predicted GIY-YIG superfamily endonuclease
MSPSTYLIHFSTNYKHARHYSGWTPHDVSERLALHQNGQGSRLCQVVTEAGIELQLVRVWQHNTNHEARLHERKIKNTHHLPSYCPICRRKETVQ